MVTVDYNKTCTADEAQLELGECPVRNLGMGSPKRPIEAILVFKDPGDWYLDLQVMMDVIMGGAHWSALVSSRS